MAAQRDSKGRFIKGSGGGARKAPATRTRTVRAPSSTVVVTGPGPATKRRAAKRKQKFGVSEMALAGLGGAVVGYGMGRWLQSDAGIKALADAKGTATTPPSGLLKYGTGAPLLLAGAGAAYVLPGKYKLLGVAVIGAGAMMVGLRASNEDKSKGPLVISGSGGRGRVSGPDLRGLAAVDGATRTSGADDDDDDDDVSGDDDYDDDVSGDDDYDDE